MCCRFVPPVLESASPNARMAKKYIVDLTDQKHAMAVVSAGTSDRVVDVLSHQAAVGVEARRPTQADTDPEETREWLESLDAMVQHEGAGRASFLLQRLLERAQALNVRVSPLVATDYVNTIPLENEPSFPGDECLERRIRAYIRWNAAVMVQRANANHPGLGGHLGTFASAAELQDVAFNWYPYPLEPQIALHD